ncbi:hypothetical protein CLG_B2106 [Clostridium botulinum D str. 1873]|uniref:Uncharacterized protein n=1 Tax=Clostridium botulinum D str. 1873 TaxID=592027 RepID=A0A9P2G8L9_CLOBO|nr:hypothetical protein CLG_B2106 [Clostridium botulinum D str. 1873]
MLSNNRAQPKINKIPKHIATVKLSGKNLLTIEPANNEMARTVEQTKLIIVVDKNGIFILFAP